MRAVIAALAAVAMATPSFAEPPKVRGLQDIYKAGFHDCAEAMADFVRFVHEDDEAYAYLGVWSQAKPNAEMATVLTSQPYTDGHGIATITGIKTVSGACNVTLTQAFTVPDQTCPKLRDDAFKGWKFYSEFSGSTLYEDPTTPNGNLTLTPMGETGCLIVKQLVRYE
ncbi:MAG: hypothetical protein ACOY5Y_12210 [Pseudomonadota bacterium]|jgi:hypothetical protein